MSTWAEVKEGWSTGWKELQRQALQRWEAAIRRDPRQFAPTVQGTVEDLQAARAHLDRIKARLPKTLSTPEDQQTFAGFSRMSARYYELAAGVYADARPAQSEVGAPPLLVVAGLVLGVAAIAWAVAAREYAKNLREQTALADRELTARVEASREGRTLQPTTLPEPDKESGGSLGWLLVGGLALAAGAAVVPVFIKKRGS